MCSSCWYSALDPLCSAILVLLFFWDNADARLLSHLSPFINKSLYRPSGTGGTTGTSAGHFWEFWRFLQCFRCEKVKVLLVSNLGESKVPVSLKTFRQACYTFWEFSTAIGWKILIWNFYQQIKFSCKRSFVKLIFKNQIKTFYELLVCFSNFTIAKFFEQNWC